MSFFLLIFVLAHGNARGEQSVGNLLHLHDLSKTALAHNLEELKVVDCQAVLAVLDKVDTDLHLTTAKLNRYPVGASLASRLLSLCRLSILLLLLEAGRDLECANENVLAAAGVGRGRGVSDVERDGDVGSAGHVELVLRVAARPKGVLRRARDGVDEDLLLVEIDQGVGEVLGRVAAVVCGRGVDAAGSRLWAACVRACGVARRGARAHGAGDRQAAALGQGALVVALAAKLLLCTGGQREFLALVERDDQDAWAKGRCGRRRLGF